jgi:hypothetical protein
MAAMRQSWSDDRLDGLSERVDLGFKRVDEQFGHVDKQFRQVGERFDRVEASLVRLEDRFDRFQLTIMVTGGGIIATLVGTCVTALIVA